MADVLADPKWLLSEAQDQIQKFGDAEKAFRIKAPYVLVSETDQATGWLVYKLKLTEQIPSDLNRQVRHIISDLRSVLDQLAYACAVADGKIDTEHAAFPFGRSEAHFQNRMKGRSKDVPEKIRDVFRSFKPYKGGNDVLWALNNMANTHKHRTLVPYAISDGGAAGALSVLGSGSEPPVRHSNKGWDPTTNEVELFAVQPGAFAMMDAMTVRLEVVIRELPGHEREPAVFALLYVADLVESIVTATEAEARQIGLIK